MNSILFCVMFNHETQEGRRAERSDKNERHMSRCYGYIRMYIVNTVLVKQVTVFLISNYCCVLNVIFFLLGDSLVSEFYVPTFWNTLLVLSSWAV